MGLHLELNNLAIQNALFTRGNERYGYHWVSVSYPDSTDDDLKRLYEFGFGEMNFIVLVDNVTLISIPYEELTEDKEQFLRTIDAVKFKIRNNDEVVVMEYKKFCSGEPRIGVKVTQGWVNLLIYRIYALIFRVSGQSV